MPRPHLLTVLLALCCSLLLHARVYQDFDRTRISVVTEQRDPSPEGVISVRVPELGDLAGTPIALVLRLRNEGAESQTVTVTAADIELGQFALGPNQESRVDLSMSANVAFQTGDAFELYGDGSGWSLEYLELANVHGFSRGLLTLVIIPSAAERYDSLNPSISFGFFVLLLLVPLPWFRLDATKLERIVSRAFGGMGLLLLGITLVSAVVSPFKILLSTRSFLLCIVMIYYPVLRQLGVSAYRQASRRLHSAPLSEYRLWGYGCWLVDASSRRLGSSTAPTISLIVLIFGALYMATLYPDVGGRINFGDSAKWQFLWVVNGTPHSTGYPLFLALSEVFGKTLVWWEPFMRITLMSYAFAIVTLCVVFLCWVSITRRKLHSLVAVCLLGTSFTFWSQATEAEVYTLNALFVSLVLYLFVRFHKGGGRRFFFLGWFVFFLSLGHHLTMVTMLPGLVYFSYRTNRRLFGDLRTVGLLLIFAVIGASQYLYVLYLSHQPSPYLEGIGRNAGLRRLVDYATGGGFRDEIAVQSSIGGLEALVSHLISTEIGFLPFIIGVGTLVVGLSGGWRRHPDRNVRGGPHQLDS